MRQMQSMDVFCSTLMLVDQNDIVFCIFLIFFIEGFDDRQLHLSSCS